MAKPPPHPMPRFPVDKRIRDQGARLVFDEYFGTGSSDDIKSEDQYSSLYRYYIALKGCDIENWVPSSKLDEYPYRQLVQHALLGVLKFESRISKIVVSSLGEKFMTEFDRISL